MRNGTLLGHDLDGDLPRLRGLPAEADGQRDVGAAQVQSLGRSIGWSKVRIVEGAVLCGEPVSVAPLWPPEDKHEAATQAPPLLIGEEGEYGNQQAGRREPQLHIRLRRNIGAFLP